MDVSAPPKATVIQNDNNIDKTANETPTFLRIPRSTRDKTYRFILVEPNVLHSIDDDDDAKHIRKLEAGGINPTVYTSPETAKISLYVDFINTSILRVGHQIYEKALEIFRAENTINMEQCWDRDTSIQDARRLKLYTKDLY
jgi:hypothetical protein